MKTNERCHETHFLMKHVIETYTSLLCMRAAWPVAVQCIHFFFFFFFNQFNDKLKIQIRKGTKKTNFLSICSCNKASIILLLFRHHSNMHTIDGNSESESESECTYCFFFQIEKEKQKQIVNFPHKSQ